jgi:hypothetical protein
VTHTLFSSFSFEKYSNVHLTYENQFSNDQEVLRAQLHEVLGRIAGQEESERGRQVTAAVRESHSQRETARFVLDLGKARENWIGGGFSDGGSLAVDICGEATSV